MLPLSIYTCGYTYTVMHAVIYHMVQAIRLEQNIFSVAWVLRICLIFMPIALRHITATSSEFLKAGSDLVDP